VRDEQVRDFTYAQLGAAANRFANVLTRYGVERGERVFSLLERVPELYVVVLGTLKHGSVMSRLLSAFGPEPIKARMTIGNAKVLVTSEALYRRKIEPWRKEIAGLGQVLLTDCSAHPPPGTMDLAVVLAQAPDSFETVPTAPEDMALLHLTSGTTGRPKGAVHVHEAVLAHHVTGQVALDLHPEDIFWCTADPGWVSGTSYGIISPLTNGVTLVVDHAEFDAERWYRILQDQKVTVWYTASPAIRMLMKAGPEIASRLICPGCVSWRAWASRSTPRRSYEASKFSASHFTTTGGKPRQGHHDLKFRLHGRQAGVDGPPLAGHHGGHC
jgi:acetyl-CoA synthetase